MSAIHQLWKAAHAAQAAQLDTRQLPAGSVVTVTHNSDGSAPDFGPARRWARTADEAFRTPTWRQPVHGPYHRPGWLRGALELAAAAVIALLLVGLTL